MTDKTESNDSEKSNDTSQNKEDEELSALLDSALEDFKDTNKSKDAVQSSQLVAAEEKRPEPPSSLWNEEFMQQTAARFEQKIQALFSPSTFSPEQLGENIQRLAEAATQTAGFDASPDLEFSGIIAQTLKNLSENADSIQSQLSEEDMMNLLGTFGNMSDPSGDASSMFPLMQNLMQSLLSKEVLLPALSFIVEKYPKWLEDNKSKISSADFDRYNEQFNLMKEVCEELEKETPNDSQEVKNSRFEKLLALMQKIQDSGQPPAEISGDLDPFLLDGEGISQLPANMSSPQCNMM